MKPDYFLGIDTSNYTTSAAVVDSDGAVIANCKCPLPVAEGACGLRQSDAGRKEPGGAGLPEF